MKSKHIKAEIRKLHIETSVLEKEIRDKTDLELKRIQDAAESEESHLRKRQVSHFTMAFRIIDLGVVGKGDG